MISLFVILITLACTGERQALDWRQEEGKRPPSGEGKANGTSILRKIASVGAGRGGTVYSKHTYLIRFNVYRILISIRPELHPRAIR